MKKRLFSGLFAAFACMMSLTSCDDLQLIGEIATEGLLGNATVVITGGGYYSNDSTNVDTVKFKSSVTDCITKTTDSGDVFVATLDFCANVDLTNANLSFPFLAFQVVDTNAAVYPLGQMLTLSRLQNFCFDSIASLIREPAGINMLVIAVSDTSWYIAHSGDIVVTTYPAVGHLMQGTFNNIGAYYFTQSDVDRLNDDINNRVMITSIEEYFHPVTMTGTFASRRANISELVQRAFYQGGLKK